MPEREPIAGHVQMKVINPKARHYGAIGVVVGFGKDNFTTPIDMEIFVLEFVDGDRERYNIVELEVVRP